MQMKPRYPERKKKRKKCQDFFYMVSCTLTFIHPFSKSAFFMKIKHQFVEMIRYCPFGLQKVDTVLTLGHELISHLPVKVSSYHNSDISTFCLFTHLV